MAGVNRVTLVGYLGKDPEMHFTPGGQSVCEMSIATSETWKDKSGEKQEKTEWHRVVAWQKTAELCAKYLAKGRLVYIEGKLETQTWEKDGVKKWKTQVVVHNVQFLGGGKDGTGKRDDGAPLPEPPPFMQGGMGDDDIPF